MKITLSQIEAFYWIARLGSFHAAAASPETFSQPTISLRIRAFEQALGLRLFDRSATQDPGQLSKAPGCSPQAERMIALSEETVRRGTPLADPLRGTIAARRPGHLRLDLHVRSPGDAESCAIPELNVALTVDNSTVLSAKAERPPSLDVSRFLVDPIVEAHVRSEPIGVMDFRLGSGAAACGCRAASSIPKTLARHEIFTNPEAVAPDDAGAQLVRQRPA